MILSEKTITFVYICNKINNLKKAYYFDALNYQYISNKPKLS
jgi:hypothetical protein